MLAIVILMLAQAVFLSPRKGPENLSRIYIHDDVHIMNPLRSHAALIQLKQRVDIDKRDNELHQVYDHLKV